MHPIAYTVTIRVPDRPTLDELVEWLRRSHIDGVLMGGAEAAQMVLHDGEQVEEGLVLEVRYMFPSREVFDTYLQKHAPALRADGLAKFGPDRGVSMERSVGEII